MKGKKMKGADIEGIERFFDEVKEDIEENNLDKAGNRMMWLLSLATVTVDNRDLLVIDGILRVSIDRLSVIVDYLKPMMERDMMEGKEAEDLLTKAMVALTDMTVLSKDHLRYGDKTKFFDSVAQDYYTLQEIIETLRLEEE